MRWLGFRCKGQTQAEITAEILFEDWVLKVGEWEKRQKYGVPLWVAGRFSRRIRLYREAMVFMVLVKKSRTDPKYEPLLRAYYSIIMPTKQTHQDSAKINALDAATFNLKQICMLNHKEIFWSIKWMKAIGFNPNDPINMSMFAYNWKSNYRTVENIVNSLYSDAGAGDPVLPLTQAEPATSVREVPGAVSPDPRNCPLSF